jgi:hypothetical protein
MLGKIGNVLGIGNAGGGYTNPAQPGMEYLNQIPGAVKPYYDPYINAGKESLASLMAQYGQLVSNPGERYSQLGQGFQESPGYQFQYEQGMNAANSAAAAGGMAGTPYAQQNAATFSSQLANQDYYNYMNQVLGLYNTGLGGQSGINQMGYGASDAMANQLSSSLMNQAGMAYQGANNQNAANQAGNSNLLQMGGAALGAFFSDERLKKDFVKVGQKNGHNLYRFRYIAHPDKEFEGVIAQEVMEINPEAVKEIGGYLSVDYDAIGIEFKEV